MRVMHIDANSFYASCERLFRPDLHNRPIIVLSNNDGIIVALNASAKDLTLKRGDPYFKVRDICDQNRVAVFSSNYTLYADISFRIGMIYNRLCPEVESYSIDESFLYYPEYSVESLMEIARTIRRTVLHEIGMPISIGIAQTKTLAKIGNKLAKKQSGGIYCLVDGNIDNELAAYPVGDIWGIGWSKTKSLMAYGVKTALDLKRFPLHLAKKHLTLTGYKTVRELNGIPAIKGEIHAKNRNIGCSRSFGQAVEKLDDLETALSLYVHEAVKRMREAGSATRYISVYLMTNPWSDVGEQYCNQLSAEFRYPTSSLSEILSTAIKLLREIYRPGYRYRKVMINLLFLEKDTVLQPEFFEHDEKRERNQALMRCFDSVNNRYGRNTLFLGTKNLSAEKTADGKASAWTMQRDFLSPEYTTKISDLPRVR